jgi:hypothetical protein
MGARGIFVSWPYLAPRAIPRHTRRIDRLDSREPRPAILGGAFPLRIRRLPQMDEVQIRKANEGIESFREEMRRTLIVPVANSRRFDASMGFKTLDDAIKSIKAYMQVAEDIEPDRREEAASHDIALYRGGRILAVLRHGPGDIVEVTVFAPDVGTN